MTRTWLDGQDSEGFGSRSHQGNGAAGASFWAKWGTHSGCGAPRLRVPTPPSDSGRRGRWRCSQPWGAERMNDGFDVRTYRLELPENGCRWPLNGHKQMAVLGNRRVFSALTRDARSGSDQRKPFFTVLFGTGREGLDSSKGSQVQILSARPIRALTCFAGQGPFSCPGRPPSDHAELRLSPDQMRTNAAENAVLARAPARRQRADAWAGPRVLAPVLRISRASLAPGRATLISNRRRPETPAVHYISGSPLPPASIDGGKTRLQGPRPRASLGGSELGICS